MSFKWTFLCLVQFQDPDFGGLSGGRVVRIAVHPDYQGVKYLGPSCGGAMEMNLQAELRKRGNISVPLGFSILSSGHQTSAPVVPRQHWSIPSSHTRSRSRDIYCDITKCLAFSGCQS